MKTDALQTNNSKRPVERWGVFELLLQGPVRIDSYEDLDLKADFALNGRKVIVSGFYDGEDRYIIRFMPDQIGTWQFATRSDIPELNGFSGEFSCTKAGSNNHGPVRVRDTFHFQYEDGQSYFPFGTTAYAWTHQGDELEKATLATLATAPFNKMRMCIFPKHYDYNHNEPELFPYQGSLEAGWNFAEFNPAYFRHLEQRILDLQQLGIEADLILFHAYDHWGFAKMPPDANDRYVRYLTIRLSAYRNVWWSLANEYDLLPHLTTEDWERIATIIQANDPYQHLRSIHNCFGFYDHTRPWITHCSVQRVDVYKTAELVNEWRETYQKPIVLDECAYEGNITHGWGNITGPEMVRRHWEGTLRGGYVGHGETYWNPQEKLWWSKGGQLVGQSPSRIGFLRKLLESWPGGKLELLPAPKPFNWNWDIVVAGNPGQDELYYFGFYQPAFRVFHMPENINWQVTVIDTWNMTQKVLSGTYTGTFQIDLPGQQWMVVRLTALN